LVKSGQPDPSPDDFSRDIEKTRVQFAELFLYHPGAAFMVYGENVPLVMLVNTFGVAGIEALLEQNALEFVLWTPMVTYNLTDIKGVDPLQSGNLNSKCHTDPEESILTGFKWFRKSPDEKTKQLLLRKVRDRYKLPPPEMCHKSARFGIDAYKANLFAPFGLPNSKDCQELTQSERARLAALATQALDLAAISHFGYNTIENYELQTVNRAQFGHLSDAKLIEQKTDVIFRGCPGGRWNSSGGSGLNARGFYAACA
jgi:hypothetical protein